MTILRVAALQYAPSADEGEALDQAEYWVEQAARAGAQVILLPELFAGPYFCQQQQPGWFDRAHAVAGHPWLDRFARLAAQWQVVLPVSFFERAHQVHFNSVMMIDADGSLLGVYRKTHIPDGPGYQEKYYFSPGDSGFRVWQTAWGRLGVGICWDQWFPEAARAMALQGAELLLYPTAIGSEPANPAWDSRDHWQRVMQGHAAANLMPVVAANRIGREVQGGSEITFYGSSFVCDATGAMRCALSRDASGMALSELDLTALADFRRSWGLFRDRRPEAYSQLAAL